MSTARRLTPLLALIGGTTVVLYTFGSRSGFGLFINPINADLGWTRETLSFAVALQAMVWGLGTPLAGALADRLGSARVTTVGGLLYAAGLLTLALRPTPFTAVLGLGVIAGFGLSTVGFNIILAAVARAAPSRQRGLYLGIASAGGSSGQVVIVPPSQWAIDSFGWAPTLITLALISAVLVPLCATALGGRRAVEAVESHGQSMRGALAEARGHGGFRLLTLGYFVCGFQTLFITTHLPGLLADRGFDPNIGAYAIALIGFFNIIGCAVWGTLANRRSKKYLLCVVYLGRSFFMAVFWLLPMTETSVLLFASCMGLLWLATVPLTSGLVAQIFGVRYMATLSGIIFMSHQLGSFLGIWLAGVLYDTTGNFAPIWWMAVALGFAAAFVHAPIDDRPLARPLPQAA